MESGWLQPIRYLWQACTRERTPRQIALGIAIGMVVGLVPKGNLTATSLAVLLALIKLNLGAALLSALVFSIVSPLADRLFHGVGWRLLTMPQLQPTWESLHQQPIIPWLNLNNTVVLGSLVIGLALLYPMYRLTVAVVVWAEPIVSRWHRRLRPSSSLGTPAATSGTELFRAIRPAPVPAADNQRTNGREAA